MSCAVVVGTRPEIIKTSSVLQALRGAGVPCWLVHSGQHYDHAMAGAFFESLELPRPRYTLGVGSGGHGEQTARVLERAAGVFREERPRLVVVQGDTNTALGAALAAAKLRIPVCHVEAGLRSHDRAMAEEINRVVVDHVAERLFAPTDRARGNLLAEGLPADRIEVTGNTVVDVVLRLVADGALDPAGLGELGVEPDGYALLTAHRAENVDSPRHLAALIAAVDGACRAHGLVALYPCHPRTRRRLDDFGIALPPTIRRTGPLGLRAFLTLARHARIVLTDSGGVQEEACILRVPCVTLRTSTERQESVDVGANVVAGLTIEGVARAVDALLSRPRTWENPFGDGRAGERIAATIARDLA